MDYNLAGNKSDKALNFPPIAENQIFLSKWRRVRINAFFTALVLLVSYMVVLHFDWTAVSSEGLTKQVYEFKKVMIFFKFASLLWLFIVPLIDYYYCFGSMQINRKDLWLAYVMFLFIFLFVATIITLSIVSVSTLWILENNYAFFVILVLSLGYCWYLDRILLIYFKYVAYKRITDEMKLQADLLNYVKTDTGISDDEKSKKLNEIYGILQNKQMQLGSLPEIINFYRRIVDYSDRLIFFCVLTTILFNILIQWYLTTNTEMAGRNDVKEFINIFFEGALCFQAILSTAIYLTISASFNRRLKGD